MKAILKKIFPEKLWLFVHWLWAWGANMWYGKPSEKMLVVGVTGTNGKSSTCLILGRLFEAAGFTVGMSSGLVIKVGKDERLNPEHMTMPGRHYLHRLLRRMVDAGCQVAIVETTSEGIKQWRHVGINYDVAVLTYLAPEHIKAHGSFENYRAAKEKLFAALTKHKKKTIKDVIPAEAGIQTEKQKEFFSFFSGSPIGVGDDRGNIPKISVVNVDDEQAENFLKYDADVKVGYGLEEVKSEKSKVKNQEGLISYIAQDIHYLKDGAEFVVEDFKYRTYLLSEMYVYNALAAISVMRALGIAPELIQKGLDSVRVIPGRLEFIANNRGVTAIVDHAHTPDAYERLLPFLRQVFPHERLIVVFGSAGGGRDPGKRPLLGELAARYGDVVIITEEDSYETPTEEILNDIERGIEKESLDRGVQVMKIEERQAAIQKASEIAKQGDVILLLGKGIEPTIRRKDKDVPWDDREALREALG